MTAKLNLAPEVYQAGQRAKQKKRLATSIAVGVGVLAGGFIVVCLIVMGGQAAYVATLNGQIKDRQQQVKALTELPKAATAAEHLETLNRLVDEKIYLTSFFKVLQTVTPQGAAVSSVTLSDTNVLEVNGTARSYSLVTKFAKAIEASNLEVGPSASPTNQAFFTDLQLSTVTQAQSGGVVDFKISAQVTPEVTTNAR
jgi:Tfp pilus assembly protein PilN